MRRSPLLSILILCGSLTAATTQPTTGPATHPTTREFNGGWTVLFPGTHRWYVSSSVGSDSAGDGSSLRPFQTLTRAVRSVHSGDDLLLKRGDVFDDWFGNQKWSHVTIGAYGIGPRPIVMPDTSRNTGVSLLNGSYVRFVGLHLAALHRDPSQSDFRLVDGKVGISCFNCNHILIEDCLIEFFDNDITIQGNGGTGFLLRRSVLRSAYSAGRGFSQGIYLDGQRNVIIEQCVFDTCGWNPILEAEYQRRSSTASSPTTAPTTAPAGPAWIASLQPLSNQPFPGIANIFNHAIYDNVGDGAGPSIVRDCIFVNSASTGVQQRPGGTIDNCLFVHNGMATDAFTSGTRGQITNCVVVGSKECPSWAGGGGLTLFSNSGKMENNLIVHGAPCEQGAALVLWYPKGQSLSGLVGSSVTIDHNIVYDWPADDFYIETTRPQVSFNSNTLAHTSNRSVNIYDTSPTKYTFASNVYEQSGGQFQVGAKRLTFAEYEQAVGETTGTNPAAGSVKFVDPTRSIESYAQLLGLPATLADFMNAADAQARGHWDPRLTAPVINDWFRQGFTLKN